MKIQALKIQNFRGIKVFEEYFGEENLVCFVGRGNSTKSTILNAIELCLSAKGASYITDADFYNSDTSKPIEIETTISNIPDKLKKESKYGLYQRIFDGSSNSFVDKETDNTSVTLTIRLNIDESLKAEWYIINDNLEPLMIGSRDRDMLGVFLISDYTDQHLSWGKGSPLFSLHKLVNDGPQNTESIVLDVIRGAKDKVGSNSFVEHEKVIEQLVESVASLGGDIADGKVTLDNRNLILKNGMLTLHRENDIPVRLDGKGTRRLVSMGIQTLLVKSGGVILVDEIEQGLEPDRVKNLVRTLATLVNSQVFMTTHSGMVVEELDAENIFHVLNTDGAISCSNETSENYQKLYRACPEAVYAKKVIICEGRTEIGLMRALDEWRVGKTEKPLSACDTVYAEGGGDEMFKRAELLKGLGLEVLILCDSDKPELDSKKTALRALGVDVLDCESGLDLEHQTFRDLNWDGVNKLIEIGVEIVGEEYIKKEVKKVIKNWDENYKSLDTDEGRALLATISTHKQKDAATKNKSWFKSIYNGQRFGEIVFEVYEEISGKAKTKENIEMLNSWINKAEEHGK